MLGRLGRTSVGAPVFLAQAGTTNLARGSGAPGHGAGLVVSEIVTSSEMLPAMHTAQLALGDARTGVRVAGREARPMVEVVQNCAGQGARIIDCDFLKSVAGLHGRVLRSSDSEGALGFFRRGVLDCVGPVAVAA